MKQYFLFAGTTYYPGGGYEDFIGHYATLQEATIVWEDNRDEKGYGYDWGHILNVSTGEVMYLEKNTDIKN